MSSSSSSQALGNASNGEKLFAEKSCNLCHASNGDGTFGGNRSRFDINALVKAKNGLANYIDAFMPINLGQPSDCTGQCALDIAAYLETFKTVASSSSESSSSMEASSSSTASSSSATAEPNVIYAYNFGGGTVVAGDTVFQQEDFVESAEHHTSTIDGAISGSEINALHKNQRWGSWTMNLPVSNGHYNVRIYTAEEYFTATDERLMNIRAEGQVVADQLDIYAEAMGHDVELVVEANNIQVSDGWLNIEFSATKDNATASAIVVTSADGARVPAAQTEASERNGIRYEPITCGAPIIGNTQIFFGPETNNHWGWDWINYPDDFRFNLSTLRFQGLEVYDLQEQNQKAPEPDCDGDMTLRRTLVRRFEQGHQHANGLGITDEMFPALRDVESIIIDLKLGYGTKVPPVHLNDGIATLTIEAGGQGVEYIKLDQNKYLGQWLRITIPAHKLGSGQPSKIQFVAEFDGGPNATTAGDNFMEVDVNIHQMLFKMK